MLTGPVIHLDTRERLAGWEYLRVQKIGKRLKDKEMQMDSRKWEAENPLTGKKS